MTVENGDNMVIYKGFQPLKQNTFISVSFVTSFAVSTAASKQCAIKYKGHEFQVGKRVAVLAEIWYLFEQAEEKFI
jgi:hypothetical protein